MKELEHHVRMARSALRRNREVFPQELSALGPQAAVACFQRAGRQYGRLPLAWLALVATTAGLTAGSMLAPPLGRSGA